MKHRHQSFSQRQSMERQTFEIFHYRDPKMQEVPIHHHDFYEVYFFLGGQVEYRVEGRTYTLEKGDLLLINPMEFHQPLVEPDAPYERIVLWIDRGYLEALSEGHDSLCACFHAKTDLFRPATVVSRASVSNLMEALVTEYYSRDYGSGLYAQGLFLQLMTELNRVAIQKSGGDANDEEHPLISQVLSYIGAHYHEALTLEDIAGQFYVSKYYLAHEFRQAVGTSVYRYILLKRLLMAKRMLMEGRTPNDVCRECGYKDYSNFYRAFKGEYGISPKEYAQDR